MFIMPDGEVEGQDGAVVWATPDAPLELKRGVVSVPLRACGLATARLG